ncbi:hypothetical protein ACF061_27155 [Streptomyces sp. NPDC015220]|uniref:hypothetical protein n=1 Tax=Streptomyces sp. NPDC015220 TaxID=3364947 RepID=UPI0036F628B3
MGKHTVRTAVTLGVTVLLGAGLGTASAAPVTPASPAGAHPVHQPKPVLVDCSMKSRVRPDEFILACGDGNSRLLSLHWSKWSGRTALAKGVNAVNDCKPYCAAGTFHSYPVVVRLDSPEPWKKDPQLRQFTRLSLLFTGARPEGYQRVVTYQLAN